MSRVARQLRFEQRVYWRNRSTAFFTFLLPLLFLGVFATVGKDREVDGRPYSEVFIPGMLGFAIVLTTFAGLAITLVIRRERGVLKRVRGTPLPPAAYMGALIGVERPRAGPRDADRARRRLVRARHRPAGRAGRSSSAW